MIDSKDTGYNHVRSGVVRASVRDDLGTIRQGNPYRSIPSYDGTTGGVKKGSKRLKFILLYGLNWLILGVFAQILQSTFTQ